MDLSCGISRPHHNEVDAWRLKTPGEEAHRHHTLLRLSHTFTLSWKDVGPWVRRATESGRPTPIPRKPLPNFKLTAPREGQLPANNQEQSIAAEHTSLKRPRMPQFSGSSRGLEQVHHGTRAKVRISPASSFSCMKIKSDVFNTTADMNVLRLDRRGKRFSIQREIGSADDDPDSPLAASVDHTTVASRSATIHGQCSPATASFHTADKPSASFRSTVSCRRVPCPSERSAWLCLAVTGTQCWTDLPKLEGSQGNLERGRHRNEYLFHMTPVSYQA